MELNELNDFQYVDWKVKPVMLIENKYGFRIILTMINGSEKTQQKGGFSTKSEANKARNNVIAQLTNRTYIVNDKVKLKPFIIYWLEKEMRKGITNDTYLTYKNSIYKYIIPKIGNLNLKSINRGHIKRLYTYILSKTKAGVRIARTILKTAFTYAITKKLMTTNPVLDTKLPERRASKRI